MMAVFIKEVHASPAVSTLILVAILFALAIELRSERVFRKSTA